jgi:hypothetical protein
MKKTLLLIAIYAASFSMAFAAAPNTPSAPAQASPASMIAVTDTSFSAGVQTALNNATTNIIYLQQAGNNPVVNLTQDGNANRMGADASGNINAMILSGDNQNLTIVQSGDGNLVNTLQLVTTSGISSVTIEQIGNSNIINAICGGGVANCNNANINWSFLGNSNSLDFTGGGNNLTSGINVAGNGNVFVSYMLGEGHQQLITVAGDNNTFNLSQTSSSPSSMVVTQNGTGAAFSVAQSGTYANVLNIQSAANGGSFNITQHSH